MKNITTRYVISNLMIMIFAGTFFLLSNSIGSAQDALSDEELSKIKDATVLIKNRSGRRKTAGTGFVFHRNDGRISILTSAHVLLKKQSGGGVRVVFRSGQKNERTVLAQIHAKVKSVDLAFLEVHDMENPPEPLPFYNGEVEETQKIFASGFPYGEALSGKSKNPEVTISSSMVSSIRTNKEGERVVYQLQGGLNPGNSGGPVFTQDGEVLGIGTKKILGSEIGFAIAKEQILPRLSGFVRETIISVEDMSKKTAKISTRSRLVDPKRNLEVVTFAYIAASRVDQEEGEWKKNKSSLLHQDMKTIELDISENQSLAKKTFKITTDEVTDKKYIYQNVYRTRKDGKYLTRPASFRIDFGRNKEDEKGWIGQDADEETQELSPEEADRSFKDSRNTIHGVEVVAMKPLEAPFTREVQESEDGQYMFVLNQSGLLQKIHIADRSVKKILDFDRSVSFLSKSDAGLLVSSLKTGELFIVDPQTLEIQHRMKESLKNRVVSSPSLDKAYTVAGEEGESIKIIDLTEQEVVNTQNFLKLKRKYRGNINAHPEAMTPTNFGVIKVSPDGDYLIAMSSETLLRFRIEDTRLIFEEIGPRIGSNPQKIEFSPDGLYVCLPSGGGNYSGLKNHPDVNYGTYIYRVENLQEPVMTIKQGAYPRTVAFLPSKQYILSQNHDSHLRVYNTTGEEIGSLSFPDERRKTRNLYGLSNGSALVQTGRQSRGENRLYLIPKPEKIE